MATSYADIVTGEADFLLELQRDTGAIVKWSDGGLSNPAIEPFFSFRAAMGLIAAGEDYYEAARDWGTWIVDHMRNPDIHGRHGIVHLWTVIAGVETERDESDADDSMLAGFLIFARALWSTYDADNMAWVEDNKDSIRNAGASLVTLLSSEGLAISKPSNGFEYLMDNSEVFKGFIDWSWLETNVFLDEDRAAEALAYGTTVFGGIEDLWNNAWGHYRWYRGLASDPSVATVLYPDALAQIYPILFDIIGPTDARAVTLWEEFKANWPTARIAEHGDPFPHCGLAMVARIMGDFSYLETFVRAMEDQHILGNRARAAILISGGSGTVGATINGTAITVPFDTTDTETAQDLAEAILADATVGAAFDAEAVLGRVHLRCRTRGSAGNSSTLVLSGTGVYTRAIWLQRARGTVSIVIAGTTVSVVWGTSDAATATALAAAIEADVTLGPDYAAVASGSYVFLRNTAGTDAFAFSVPVTNIGVFRIGGGASGATGKFADGRAAHLYPYFNAEAGWLITAMVGE